MVTKGMIAHVKILFITTFSVIWILAFPGPAALSEGTAGEKVDRVIDGDTLMMRGGERVRLTGIDAPERGEALFEMAGERLREMLEGGPLRMEVCGERDEYGRILATVMAGSVNVNLALLREGMALPMLIPPCGKPVASEVLEAASAAALSGRGIYSLQGYEVVSHLDAANMIGEHCMVRGKIMNLHRGKKAVHLNFGLDWKTDFTAVIMRQGQRRFSALGIDPADLVGREVLVIGRLKRYNGPEIIVRGPEQILTIRGSAGPDSRFRSENRVSLFIEGRLTENRYKLCPFKGHYSGS